MKPRYLYLLACLLNMLVLVHQAHHGRWVWAVISGTLAVVWAYLATRSPHTGRSS